MSRGGRADQTPGPSAESSAHFSKFMHPQARQSATAFRRICVCSMNRSSSGSLLGEGAPLAGGTALGVAVEQAADLGQGEAGPLGHLDQCDPAHGTGRVDAPPAARSAGGSRPTLS